MRPQPSPRPRSTPPSIPRWIRSSRAGSQPPTTSTSCPAAGPCSPKRSVCTPRRGRWAGSYERTCRSVTYASQRVTWWCCPSGSCTAIHAGGRSRSAASSNAGQTPRTASDPGARSSRSGPVSASASAKGSRGPRGCSPWRRSSVGGGSPRSPVASYSSTHCSPSARGTGAGSTHCRAEADRPGPGGPAEPGPHGPDLIAVPMAAVSMSPARVRPGGPRARRGCRSA